MLRAPKELTFSCGGEGQFNLSFKYYIQIIVEFNFKNMSRLKRLQDALKKQTSLDVFLFLIQKHVNHNA